MRILILDDEEIALSALETSLRRAGHEPIIASNGEEALDLVRSGNYRIVISDWMMPGMSGIELCRRIREEVTPSYVYFIMLTSREGTEAIIEGLSAGADEFISKPFCPAELSVRIRAAERILSLETRDVTIFALAKLAESRDPETGAHVERVRDYSKILAQDLLEKSPMLGVDSEFVRLIYLTSPLHDIGKVGIPDKVLLKPGRLTADEFELMKTHTIIGGDTLNAAVKQFPSVRFLRMAKDIALAHHERFDGTGYPRGLAGGDIPLSGRLVAVADVYDALTSCRVYKDAYSHEYAKKIVLDERGRHFDPLVVDAFKRREQEFVGVLDHYREPEAPAPPTVTETLSVA